MLHFAIVMGLMAGAAEGPAACAGIGDDAGRLACYDSFFRPSAGQVPLPRSTQVPVAAPAAVAAAPTASAAAAATPTPPPVEEFGLTTGQREERRTATPKELDRIESRLVSVKQQPRDRFLLSLENGQVWLQTEPSPRQRFIAGETVTIRRAALGSYLASGPTSGGTIRVRRVE